MTIPGEKALNKINKLLQEGTIDEFKKKIAPEDTESTPLPDDIPGLRCWNQDACQKRINLIEKKTSTKIDYLTGKKQFSNPETLKGNIEHYIGMTQVPTGIIGPLRVNGSRAKGDYYIPLATSEGALIASYNRGAKAISLSGGASSICLSEAIQRTPLFKFKNFSETAEFTLWVMANIEKYREIIATITSHGKLEDVKPNIEGNQITLVFEFTTGDASGQNMITICTDAICKYIIKNTPVKPQFWLVESNLSGDKKASAISLSSVRGKKVTAEALLAGKIVEKYLNTTTENIFEAWKAAIVNGIQSGSIGVNFHVANCLTAIFLACGQDVATVSEASIGITRFDLNSDGDLYISVTLPNLIVGTVGGGTYLPTMTECLNIIGCYGTGKAIKFAEICAAVALCGEISICASIASGDFARAHTLFGRK
jgi:hydroxymethylglutaryl-CoA reductase (NADPH)